MGDTKQTASIHAKKYYKVVLEEIDRNRETRDTFAMKLSIRTRMTMPRAKAVVRHLPRIVRKEISATEANKLKAVLEDIGGRARVESYLVTPGEGRGGEPDPRDDERRDERRDEVRIENKPGSPPTCPECREVVDEDAKFCPFCHRRFRDERARSATLEDRLPEDNPLKEPEFTIETSDGWVAWLKENPLVVASAILIALLLILVIK